MDIESYQEAYNYYIAYYSEINAEQLAEIKRRTQSAAMVFVDCIEVQSFAAGKVAAIDELIGRKNALICAQSGVAEQQHF